MSSPCALQSCQRCEVGDSPAIEVDEAGNTDMGAVVEKEEHEPVLPPVWMGGLRVLMFQMALLLAFAGEWSIQGTVWKVCVILLCLIVPVPGVVYLLFFTGLLN